LKKGSLNDDSDEEKVTETNKKSEPSHFSVVDTQTLHAKVPSGDFPLLANVVKTTFTLKAGEMLYLPASWFHEVISYNEKENRDDFTGHLAFNYWFHPPTTKDYNVPYDNDYWLNWWKELETPITFNFNEEENSGSENEENRDEEKEENENEENENEENEENEIEEKEGQEEPPKKGGKRKRDESDEEAKPTQKKSKK